MLLELVSPLIGEEPEPGGGTRIRTGDKGFADLGLTTWLCRHIGEEA